MVWVACVSGPMKVTPSAACRDNKGFTFTAQAYQVEAEHVHSRVNKRVWETDSVGGQKSSYAHPYPFSSEQLIVMLLKLEIFAGNSAVGTVADLWARLAWRTAQVRLR